MNKYRLGLSCMGMNLKNKNESIETIKNAINNGINLINTGEFYQQGESELVVGEALKDIPRDNILFLLSLECFQILRVEYMDLMLIHLI